MEIIVVFPFCHKDAMRLLKNLEWQAELATHWPECVLSYDRSVNGNALQQVRTAAGRCYGKIHEANYPNPTPGDWPPNHAFRETAIAMEKYQKPWLWFEADIVPLCPDWLPRLNDAYAKCGRKFFAPQVFGMWHFNGTGVYPSDTPNIIPNGLRERRTAWDVAMKPEMEHQTADAGCVLQHAWTMSDGKLHPCGGGREPRFRDRNDLRLLFPTAVLFHRDKSLSLIDRLRECKKELP